MGSAGQQRGKIVTAAIKEKSGESGELHRHRHSKEPSQVYSAVYLSILQGARLSIMRVSHRHHIVSVG